MNMFFLKKKSLVSNDSSYCSSSSNNVVIFIQKGKKVKGIGIIRPSCSVMVWICALSLILLPTPAALVVGLVCEEKNRDGERCTLFVWLVLICCERKVQLVGCWWLVCSERNVLLAGG
jgi:hypothetical protein